MPVTVVETTLPDSTNGQCGFLSLAYDGFIKLEDICDIDTEYCLTMYVKANATHAVKIVDYDIDPYEVNESWTRLIAKFTATSKDLAIGFDAGDYYLWKWQLEKGNIESDWKENNEDIKNAAVSASLGQWCYDNDVTYIDGGKIYTGTIDVKSLNADTIGANEAFLKAIFAEDIIATGSIKGVTITGASGEFTKSFSVNTLVKKADNPEQDIYFKMQQNKDGVFIGIKSEDAQANSYLMLDALTTLLTGRSVTIGGRTIRLNAQNSLSITAPGGVSINGKTTGNIVSKKWSNTGGYDIEADWSDTLNEVSLSPGTYMITATLKFGAASGGVRAIRLTDNIDGIGKYVTYPQSSVYIGGPASAKPISLQTTLLVTLEKNASITIEALTDADCTWTSAYIDVMTIA